MAEELTKEAIERLYREDEKFRIMVKAWVDMENHRRYHITVQKVDRLVRVMAGGAVRK